jgi:putative transposase
MRRERPEQVIEWVDELRQQVPTRRACGALTVPPAWYYRQRTPAPSTARALARRPTPAHALSEAERRQVRETLNRERFQDEAPRTVYATLLDEEKYLCHWRTMYRILAVYDEVRERRRLRRQNRPAKPQLVARAANDVWSWDITRLPGAKRGPFFFLYVMLDLFSRFVVGWMVARRESKALAEHFVASTYLRQGITPGQLTVHSDRGSPMRAGTMADLLAQLQVNQSFARPRTPDDNPYSEAQFKTMKYRHDFPDSFADEAAVQQWASGFFSWYNHEHYHVALGLMTPATVYQGQATAVQARRQAVLDAAYAAHPARFGGGRPRAAAPPNAVWSNPPAEADTAFSDPAPSSDKPGAQTGSRDAGSDASLPGPLDAGEHLARLSQGRGQTVSMATTFLEANLSQNA